MSKPWFERSKEVLGRHEEVKEDYEPTWTISCSSDIVSLGLHQVLIYLDSIHLLGWLFGPHSSPMKTISLDGRI